MNGFDSPTVLGLLIVAQLLGIFIAWAARLSEAPMAQVVSQCLFFLALPLIALMTACALVASSGCWLMGSATITIMVLTVTCDFRTSREAATW